MLSLKTLFLTKILQIWFHILGCMHSWTIFSRIFTCASTGPTTVFSNIPFTSVTTTLYKMHITLKTYDRLHIFCFISKVLNWTISDKRQSCLYCPIWIATGCKNYHNRQSKAVLCLTFIAFNQKNEKMKTDILHFQKT